MEILIIGGCGYIGSALFRSLQENHSVTTVDLEWFGNYINPNNIKLDYGLLTIESLVNYEVIILLAGHSSVGMCLGNNISAFNNNVVNFVYLLEKLPKECIFIYASSSSLYCDILLAKESDISTKPNNSYDLSKYVIDLYASLTKFNYYGLRFGTVNGYSENLRGDLMINKMYLDGLRKKHVTITNLSLNRPILGINDLVKAIQSIINNANHPGIYNLASFNSTVGEIGTKVANYLNVDLIELPGGQSSYNFGISTDKFMKIFNFKFNDDLQSILENLNNHQLQGSSSRNNKQYYVHPC